MSIRVLVCDEQTLVRVGLRAILEPESDIEVIGETGDGHQTVKAARDLRPDVLLMGTPLLLLDGIQVLSQLAGPDIEQPVPAIILGAPDDEDAVLRAVQAGARGFLRKDGPTAELIHAIRVVAAGQALLTPLATRCLLDRVANTLLPSTTQLPPAVASLTNRESDVLELLARGYSNSQIAEALSVRQATVRSHVHRLLTKLGLHDRAQAVAFAYQHALVSPIVRAARLGDATGSSSNRV
jgi:DNA-binding NarL/FixJ family response regulator